MIAGNIFVSELPGNSQITLNCLHLKQVYIDIQFIFITLTIAISQQALLVQSQQPKQKNHC